MKHVEYEYVVKAIVELSLEEVEALIGMAELHYDYECKALAKKGGLLFGFRNRLSMNEEGEPPVPFTLTSREVDILCKVLEPLSMTGGDTYAERFPLAVELWFPMIQLIKGMNSEYRRLN